MSHVQYEKPSYLLWLAQRYNNANHKIVVLWVKLPVLIGQSTDRIDHGPPLQEKHLLNQLSWLLLHLQFILVQLTCRCIQTYVFVSASCLFVSDFHGIEGNTTESSDEIVVSSHNRCDSQLVKKNFIVHHVEDSLKTNFVVLDVSINC